MRLGRALAFVVAGVIVACGSFGESDDTSSTSEAGADALVPVDGPFDGEVPLDGGADPGIDGASPCANGASHWVCDDFDHEGGVGPPIWDQPNTTGGGVVLVAPSGNAPTPPSVLLGSAMGMQYAQIQQKSSVPVNGLRCDLDMLIAAFGSLETMYFQINLSGPTSSDGINGAYVRLELRGASGVMGLRFYGRRPNASAIDESAEVTMPGDVWTHFAIVLAFGKVAKSSVKVNGVELAAGLNLDLSSFSPTVMQNVAFGPAGIGGGASATSVAQYDNIVCDYIP